MARPQQTGLTYFPLDIDFFDDEKILMTTAKFGVQCEGIIIRLMCRIYRNGYYIDFGEDMALLIARSAGDSGLKCLVIDIVNELLRRGFFSQELFDRFRILTSHGFQKRFLRITERRKSTAIKAEYSLLDVDGVNVDKNPHSSPVNANNNTSSIGVNVDKNPLNKTKENKTKEKESKENHNNEPELMYTETRPKLCGDGGSFVFENEEVLEEQFIRPAFKQFLENLSPNNQEISGVKNAILKDENLSPEVAAKIVYEAFEVIAITKPENRNTRYLFGIIKKKKQDHLAQLREQAIKREKDEQHIERRELLKPGSIRNEFLRISNQPAGKPVTISEILTPVMENTTEFQELPTE